MVKKFDRNKARQKRHLRVRNKIAGTADCPRLNVFRSSKHIYAQIIDDNAGVTLVSASSMEKALKAAVPTRKLPARLAKWWASGPWKRESKRLYSTVAATFITDVSRSWQKALVRADLSFNRRVNYHGKNRCFQYGAARKGRCN